MKHYLIVYNVTAREILRLDEYADERRAEALSERFRLESVSVEDPNLEIVILSADSRQQLEATHGRYFKSVDQLARG